MWPIRDIGIFATGGKNPSEGWSGVRTLFERSPMTLNRVAVIVTNHENGWVATLYKEFNTERSIALEVIKDFPKREQDGEFSPTAKAEIMQIYRELKEKYGLKYIFLSGYIKQIFGLAAHEVVNIHPGPLGKYGGNGMHGNHVHEKIWRDYFDGKIISSAVTMHFVPSDIDDDMDTGPIIAQVPVSLEGCKSPSDIQKRVNAMEHRIQWQVSEYIIDEKITWSGVRGEPVHFEEWLTLDIDDMSFLLDGKTVDLSQGLGGYDNVVVRVGDNASGNFKEECDNALRETPAFQEWLLRQTATGAWETIIPSYKMPTRVKEDIDGVGTKVHIYLDMFEDLCQKYRDGKISEEACILQSRDICWVPMLHDLIAMNADDLRDGQMAVSVTNIIDINHLRWMRGRIFSQSMGKAMGLATREIGIGNVAGETAVVESGTIRSYSIAVEDLIRVFKEFPHPTTEQQEYINKNLAIHTKKIDDIENCIDFNIGGTVQGLIQGTKLVTIQECHVLVALYEKPDKNGIIGPRSNGITTIRNSMKDLTNTLHWPSMAFEDFLIFIWSDQAAKLPESLKRECAGLTLGQIATGTTTVFNSFVSRDLLGGLDWVPSVQLSSLTNVTWNPRHKIRNGLRGAENMVIDIDMTSAKIPQIIEIIQRLKSMPDEEAMSSWNMGVPYVLACPPSEVEKIVEKAQVRWIRAEAIGAVKAKTQGDPVILIRGVGIWNSIIAV